ncbi:MAG: hypothetical protein K0R65_2036 [Crocinitomicaceae bacterium]|jgi:hypothetical protein|nr:hypothetical protein [Crocinitomicaceae bacterium]
MDFRAYQKELSKELDQFTKLLNEALPRYTDLVRKINISDSELVELGELEYFLIEVNGKIAELKKQLEHDLFGLSLDLYYKLKQRASQGDLKAARKIVTMRAAFNKSLRGNNLINWN